ncbi:MAG TPA: recombinase family protein [Acidobacteriota bacterium]|jgi:DNA invertase Pin-like site-specific DNA recombinase
MRQCFAYIRVSTPKQGERGVSLQEQRAAIERFAARNNLTVCQWFEERETAAKRGRPVFNRMLKLLRRGSAAGVIIHKIDRGARNLKDWADLGELIDQGIEIFFANESLDLRSRGGRLSADIQAVVAADYIRNLREETRKGFYGRLNQGLLPMQAPLGYSDIGPGKPKSPDPVRAPLIRRAFELYSTARHNLDTLGDELFRLGLRTRRGNEVSRNGLSTILRNPFYTGVIRLRRTGEHFPGVHEPVVSKALFDSVQSVLDGKFNIRSQKHEFLFRRLLKCKLCNYSLVGEKQKGHIYYRCHTASCPTTAIREEAVENSLVQKLFLLRFSAPEQAYLRQKLSQIKADWIRLQKQLIDSLNLQLSAIQERFARLTDAYIDRLVDQDTFVQRKNALLGTKRDVEEKLVDLSRGGTSLHDRLARFLELAGSAYSAYKTAILDKKRDLVENLTSNRLVIGKNAEFMLKVPFDLIANRFEYSTGSPLRDRLRTWDELIPKIEMILQKTPIAVRGQEENDDLSIAA